MSKLERILFPVFMSMTMSIPMSFVMTAVNVGFSDHFIQAFLRSALIGICVSMPIAFIAVPRVRKLVSKIAERFQQRASDLQ